MSSQMEKFGQCLKDYSEGREPQHYPGEHNRRLAMEIAETAPDDAPVWMWSIWGGFRTLAQQSSDLAAFGVGFDHFARESMYHESGVAAMVMRCHGALGGVYQDGKMGPICINCAHLIQPGRPCDFCINLAASTPEIVMARHILQGTEDK